MHTHSYGSMYFLQGSSVKAQTDNLTALKDSHCYLFMSFVLFIFILLRFGFNELHMSSVNVCKGRVWSFFWAINSSTG